MTTIEEIGYKALNDAYNNDLGQEVANYAKQYAEFGAAEQKAIDNAEKTRLIEKVIWLIEDSYPDTVEWPYDDLVRNVTEDLERRADSLREMFG